MFLEMLNDELKEQFLCLAIKAAEANGIVDNKEKQMISLFAREMQINPFYSCNKSEEALLDEISSKTTSMERRIILFELAGIILSDEVLNKEEDDFLVKVAEKFEIGTSYNNDVIGYIKEYSNLYKKMYKRVINGE